MGGVCRRTVMCRVDRGLGLTVFRTRMTPTVFHATRTVSFVPQLSSYVCRACDGLRCKAASGQVSALRLGGRRGTADSAAVLALRSRRRTHFAHYVRFVQTNAGESVIDARKRADLRAVLLAASEARSDLPERAFAETLVVFAERANTVAVSEPALALRDKPPTLAARQAVPGRGDFWGGEEHRARVGARSALQQLTRGRCLNEASRR